MYVLVHFYFYFHNDFHFYFQPNVILQSCGIADVIASSLGGRNHKCAEEFIVRLKDKSLQNNFNCEALWTEVENELLNGQKLQGLQTCYEVVECIQYFNENKNNLGNTNFIPKFPLFKRIYEISKKLNNPTTLCDWK